MEKRAYSATYTPVEALRTPKLHGLDGWRQGLVAGNGENGVIESCGPAKDVMIFQNIKFGYPTNAIRMTPDMSQVREETIQSIISCQGESLSADGAKAARDAMLEAASLWMEKMGYGSQWFLQHTYAFHPAHQLLIQMLGQQNGEEKTYRRYTDYQTGQIGSDWTDKNGARWRRRTFSSREDNVTITEISSPDGEKVSLSLSIEDIAAMSDEAGVKTKLSELRYRKVIDVENASYIGLVAHYPYYRNSELNNAGFAGITRVIAQGENHVQRYCKGNGVGKAVNPLSGAEEKIMQLGYDHNPSIVIENADSVLLITKADRDTAMGSLGAFEEQEAWRHDVRNGMTYDMVRRLLEEMAVVVNRCGGDASFAYEKALTPSAQKHSEMFNRLTFSACVAPEDIAMAAYSNEQLIQAQRSSPNRLLPAMLERLYSNGRFAAICASGIQAPRLGGMWTGAWGCQWSGDYTTDANINLQVAGANIGNLPEETIGFINVMLKNIMDWEMNARQVYGIENALLAPPRTDGDTAVLNHFGSAFPGQIWNSGASWLLLPMVEFFECYGNQPIPLSEDIRKALERTDNKHEGYQECLDKYGKLGKVYHYDIRSRSANEPIVYNLRNTLGLSDARAEEILRQGFFDLEEDILYPLLTKTANFWLGFVDARYYVAADGRAVYDERHVALQAGETYLIAPSYSPENCPENTLNPYTANAVMDIDSTRYTLETLIKLGEKRNDQRLPCYEHLLAHLSPHRYEEGGELKEWALVGYGERYGHRHGSQFYGVWPAYYGEADRMLFEGCKALVRKKNSIDFGDSRSGHGWLHRSLVMARLKDGEGVKETINPLVTHEMIYTSMMMAHNNDGHSAYCTDPVITLPAILLETLVYSDATTIELLPALLPEMEMGGAIEGTKGVRTRCGAIVSNMRWNKDTLAAVILCAKGVLLKIAKPCVQVTVNGEDVTCQFNKDGGYFLQQTDCLAQLVAKFL